MGTWSTSITGNDTARDLYIEYSAVFFKYDVEEALEKIDHYVRKEMFDESDPEEWCNYFYSLTDFMWKKGILTDDVRDKAIEMIDGGFGLELWEEAGQKILDARKKKLEEFKQKILSPQPPKRKIKLDVHTERIFDEGDIIAVQLQTAGKPYTEQEERPLSEEEFHSLDGKFVLMQLIGCRASWSSAIVPEVKDYWAHFRLFDGIYDTIPEAVDVASLTDAGIHGGQKIYSIFYCESNMFYFKRRKYKVIGNEKNKLPELIYDVNCGISWGINKPWLNPDSQLVAAMGKRIICGEFEGTAEQLSSICRFANRYGRFNYRLTREQNEANYLEEEKEIARSIDNSVASGGKLLSIVYGRKIGIVTLKGNCVNNIYIEGRYQNNGFGTALLQYAFSCAENNAYIEVPKEHSILLHICEKLGLQEAVAKDSNCIRMLKR